VNLADQERAHLLGYYFERNGQRWKLDEFKGVYLDCGIQRLMQALGAYGVIGLVKEKREFLRHIRPAIKTLIEVASAAEDFRFFGDFLAGLPDRPQTSIGLA
jgi:N-acetylmuramate 1-kinase